jgi:Fungal Zn(2)-Cys(6) binuclear cluster domain
MRRQNHSCDQCRRIKRRCAFPVFDERAGQKSCINCTRLRNSCTFDFVNIQSAKREKRKSLNKNGNEKPARPPSSDSSPADGNVDDQNTTSACINVDPYAADTLFFPGANDIFDEDWFNYGTFPALDLDIELNTAASLSASAVTPDDHEIGAEKLDPSHMNRNRILNAADSGLAMPAISTPMQLLNASITAATVNSILASLYDKVLAGASSRFLNYSCNIFGGTRLRLYCLQDRYPSQWPATTPSQQRPDGLRPPHNSLVSEGSARGHSAQVVVGPAVFRTAEGASSPLRAAHLDKDPQMMTLLGLVRFLDHFSELYGNKLDSRARKESDNVLASVMQAFSMQWLAKSDDSALESEEGSLYCEPLASYDLSEPGIRTFLDTWFRARSDLRKARSTRSFTMIYAIFLFNMTVRPTGLSATITEMGQPHEFLDEGLKHLCVLQKLVQKYCGVLGNTSIYAKAMRSCLNMMRWFGYIRDTVSSFTDARKGLLLDFLDAHEGKTVLSTDTDLFDTDETRWIGAVHVGLPSLSAAVADLDNISDLDIQEISRVIMFHIFQNWRRIIRVRAHFEQGQPILPSMVAQISSDITAAVAAVANFDLRFASFLESCQQRFSRLSPASRTSSGTLFLTD